MKKLFLFLALIPTFCLANPNGFIKNHGQVKDTDGNFRNDILFKYEQAGLSVFFFADKVSYVLQKINEKDSSMQMHRVDWKWKNCNDIIPNFDGSVAKLPNNFYLDSIEITGVESGRKIMYSNIYSGVSLVFYLKDHLLKYDYIVDAASALNQIKSTYSGAEFNLLPDGQLEIQTSFGTILDSKPISFDKNGKPIRSEFILKEDELAYGIQENIEYPITIDPEVQWSTYFGGFNNEFASEVEHDDSNNVYIIGSTASTNFPTTTGAYAAKNSGFNDCFISKLSSDGKLIWSTYFGGANNDQSIDIEIDHKGTIHCASLAGFGTTFPITSNARKKSNPENGAYSRFDRNGKLLYSTFIPLTEANLATDTSGKVYLFGRSNGFFPIKGNSFQTRRKGFIDFGLMCFDNKDTLEWSTYVGGSSSENGRVKIDVNSKGDKIALLGFTQSTDFPLKRPYADSATSSFNVFLVASCFNSKGNLMWSTYLCPPDGTNGFTGSGLTFITDDKLAIGSSNLQSNFPVKKNNWIRKANLQGAFIAIFDTAGTAQRVSFDSPQSQSFGRGITDISVDKDLNLHVVCEVSSDSIRTTADALKKEGSNFYIGTNQGEIGYIIMDTSLNIKYATYIGGRKSFDNTPFISVNSLNEATIVLSTANNSDFPTKNAYQSRLAGASDIALIQFGCNYEPKLSLPKNATICKGDSVTLKVDSGLTKYVWSPSQSSSNTLTAKNPGKYYVIITDNNGCLGGIKDSFELNQLTPLNPIILSLDATQFCSGDSARLRGRVSNYKSLRWSNGDTTLRTAAFKSGKYFLTATDSNGCVDTSNNINMQAIPKPNPIITSNTGSTNFCRKYSEISLDVGLGYSAYKWSTGATTNSIKVSKTGWYKVVVFNGFNCSDSDSVFVRNSFATAPVISNVNPLKFCNGDSVTFTAPTGYSNFLWSTGSRSSSIKVGRNSDIFLIASDTNGCRDTSSIIKTLKIIDSLKVRSSGIGPFCFDETLTLVVDTGYSAYKWSNGDSIRSISVKTSGNYSVSAISASGCRIQSDTFRAKFFSKTNAQILYDDSLKFCSGDSLRLFFTGPFNSFSWSNSNSTTQSIYIKQSGVYILSIIDTNNCKAVSDSVRVFVDPLPIVKVTSNKGLALCDKDSSLIGTNKSFNTYNWSNGFSTSSFYIKKTSNLWVEVTDNNGCSNFSDTILVTKFDLPDTAAYISGANTFCQGDSITIHLRDTANTVRWNDNVRSYNRVIRKSGIYRALLQNRFGCVDSTREFNITVNSNPAPKLIANGPTQYCENLGPRRLSINNNFLIYTWSNNSTTASISTNASGNYFVKVVDSNGCLGNSDTVSLIVNSLPKPEIIGSNGSSFCNGDSTFVNTKKPYSKYLWSNRSTSNGFTVKQNTTLFVEVTDSNGCINRSSPLRISTLPLPSPFTIGAVDSLSVCFPNTVTLNGPSNQSKYIWSNGANGDQITIDSTQKVSLIVENIFGCQRKASDSLQIYVGVPAPLMFEGDVSFCLGDSFYIEANRGYSSYQWSNGSKLNSISITTSDTFYITTVDSIGCTFNSDTFITEARPLKVPSPWSIARGNTEFCNGDSLELLSPKGYTSYAWNNGDTNSSTYIKNSGSFEVVVIDSLGCRGRSPAIDVTVFELPKPIITAKQNVFCSGDTVQLGVANIYLKYLWSTSSFNAAINVVENGTYNVTIQDTNQCFGRSQDFVVEFYKKPSFSIDTLNISGICNGDSLTLNVNLTEEKSTIIWTDGEQNGKNTIKSNETYGFTVTNEAGCKKSLKNSIFATFQNPLPSIIINGNDSICFGESVELKLAKVYDQILWNESAVQESISVSSTGYNSVLVTDINGCQGVDSVLITAIALPKPKLNLYKLVAICPLDSVLLNTTIAFNSYQWNNGSTEPSLWILNNGTFWLDVSNDFGCTNRSDTVELSYKQIPDSIRLIHEEGVIRANTDSLDSFKWYKGEAENNFELLELKTKKVKIRESNFYYLAAQSKGCELISDTLFVEYYDSSKTLDFALYPNPTFGNILLDIDAVNANNIWCFLIDAQGKIIKTYDLGIGDRIGDEIDLIQLNKGIYLVKLVNGDKIYTQPFVKIE